MSSQKRVLCGVPKEFCNGSNYTTDQGLPPKAHASHEDAFRCMAHYLVKTLGYKRVGGREFAPPDGGPIRILSKKMRYGGLLVYGKERSRYMPERRHAGNRGSIVG